MKVVGVSNFDKETVSDLLIAENVILTWAVRFAKLCNEFVGDDNRYHFVVKLDDYKLYKWSP